MLLLQSYNPYYVCSQYPSDFRAYLPSNYRVERSSPIKLCGVGAVGHGDAISAGNSGRGIKNNATSAGSGGHVKCSFPLDNTQLKGIDMPESDWDALIASLWAPWFVALRCVALPWCCLQPVMRQECFSAFLFWVETMLFASYHRADTC